ncbi:unnamed protein product [Bursaphelenchus okinawaensis]|uniref:DUF5600 domain-containing protein n=1 Tax=Bursaphelenchus okinawaensis TaxID=465554 RepID=A0A811KLC9_9BILA|nr:unnamed protein product [Bursaphelenchus okinawaensis]CAG9106170.1 unnamed protein product [Bursaphelenchus okinawaensis]
MADKVDLIICVFDTTKLDMSDEFKQVLKGLTGNDEKIKIVLNKADCVSPSELVRVRGALMWGLSKIIDTPEVPKVYIGSFTDELKNPNIMSVFKSDYMDLFHEIEQTPTRSLARKVNDMIKRAKKVKLHARIMTEIMRLKRISKGNGPPMKALTTPVVKLAFFNVQKDLAITDYDMPNFQNFLEKGKLTQAKHWNKINKKEMEKLDQFILQDIPNFLSKALSYQFRMLQLLPHDEKNTESMKDAFARLRDIVEKANEEEKKSDETSKKGSKKESKKESKKDRSKKKDKSKSRSKSKSKEEKSKEDSKKKNKSKDKSDKSKAEKKEDEKSKGEKKEDKSKAEKKEEKSKSEVKDEKSKGEKKDEKSKGEKKEEKEKEEKKDEKSKGEKKEEKEKSKSEAQEDKDKSKAEKKD